MYNNKFLLVKSFDFYFLQKYNMFLMQNLQGIRVLRMPAIYLFKKEDFNYSFLFLKFEIFKSFLTHFIIFYNKLIYLFYSKLKLRGLGFRIIRVCENLYKFYFTSINFFYLHVPFYTLIKLKIKKLFILCSDYALLREIIVRLLLLKQLIVYRISGLLYPREILIMKPGKKRF